jgi:hypothetical protein
MHDTYSYVYMGEDEILDHAPLASGNMPVLILLIYKNPLTHICTYAHTRIHTYIKPSPLATCLLLTHKNPLTHMHARIHKTSTSLIHDTHAHARIHTHTRAQTYTHTNTRKPHLSTGLSSSLSSSSSSFSSFFLSFFFHAASLHHVYVCIIRMLCCIMRLLCMYVINACVCTYVYVRM